MPRPAGTVEDGPSRAISRTNEDYPPVREALTYLVARLEGRRRDAAFQDMLRQRIEREQQMLKEDE